MAERIIKSNSGPQFEDLKLGTILGTYNALYLVVKKSSKKVWFLSFESKEAPRTVWRRNYGDTDSYDFYYASDFPTHFSLWRAKQIIIRRAFNKS